MDPGEYALEFFHRGGFTRRTCAGCGAAFWALGDLDRCQEEPCTPYSFIGHPIFRRPATPSEMRETFLRFFEQRGHQRVRRYPTVARWRNDVFFTQASIYDFQPWVTSGAIPPPANPLTISQPCARFNDLAEVGHSGRHFTLFEMMAHHAFNRPDHTVYFKERCVELCHELLTEELGADARGISYKEEEWEGGGNLGPSLSVGIAGLELATLVFMEYVRSGARLQPMPLTVVDTGYGLERFVWSSHGTKNAYEAVFGPVYDEMRATFAPAEAAILIDHARSVNFLLTDGVVPSNSKEGYYARLILRRMLRILAKAPEAPGLPDVLDRVGREIARDFPEVGEHRADLRRVIEAEIERYDEAIGRARAVVRRHEERIEKQGGSVTEEDLLEWYDSLGLPPDVAVAELKHPIPVPADFYPRVAARHESETPVTDYTETASGLPPVPASVPDTKVEYYLDPYTRRFDAHVLFSEGPYVVLDRTFFYPTGGGQISDTGELAGVPVVDVARAGRWVFHRLDRPTTLTVGERVHGVIDDARRTQLMQHHTATHLLNGALREALGPHVWQAGAFKGTESARIDITHFRALSAEEVRTVERRVNRIIRENRPVKSYFEPRNEAERRFGFTLYQGGAVPGRDLRIVEIEGFDVEACGGTHCTRTGEVGLVTILGSERIQDGVVRLSYAAGERALDVLDESTRLLQESAHRLGVPRDKLAIGIDRLLTEVDESRRRSRSQEKEDLKAVAERLGADGPHTATEGDTTIVSARVTGDRSTLMELSRLLTRGPNRVAILAAEADGRGLLFIGSTTSRVPAAGLLEDVRSRFGGKGGGNPSAATAVGDPGEPLDAALAAARSRAVERLRAGPP
ncbi:MAG TPA: alanine--tRNA ligase [Thermoplasmata archaeon]|nr:alanine--tRNA ligase [Thermoplasmata archaeon]